MNVYLAAPYAARDKLRDYPAERLAARAATYRTNVARRRALIGTSGEGEDERSEGSAE